MLLWFILMFSIPNNSNLYKLIKSLPVKQTFRIFHSCRNNMSNTFNYTIGIAPFCYKQFDNKKSANHIPMDKLHFIEKVRELIKSGDCSFGDGYAPFCKHVIVKNFTEAVCGYIEITTENEHLLKSDYLARVPTELPVLTRWFNKRDVSDSIKKATYLDLIFYSKEQIILEDRATNTHDTNDPDYKYDYYLVSVKPQAHDYTTPMLPITMMRNTMIEEGGSGVKINREAYAKSVEYWKNHAIVLD